MRKSFYRKVVVVALVGTASLWAWIVYAQPENWIVTTCVFSLLLVGQWWSFRVSGKAAAHEGGFADELKSGKRPKD